MKGHSDEASLLLISRNWQSLVFAAAILLCVVPAMAQSKQSTPLASVAATARTNAAQARFYNKRLQAASPAIMAKLRVLNADVLAKKLPFSIGYTTALDRPLERLAGARVPPDLLRRAAQQNKFAAEAMRLDEAQARRSHVQVQLRRYCSSTAQSWDWRGAGKVTPVRDQGGCGSCWDFAATAAYESAYLIRNNISVDTSEQHVLQCANAGTCGGGWYTPVWDWMLTTKVTMEDNLPYTATDGICPNPNGYYQDVAWGYVTVDGEIPTVEQIKQALCEHGPLAVAMMATGLFQAYTGGIYDEPNVTGINHGFVIVGWDDSNRAWIVKNSWGTGWGESGYFRIRYGSNLIGYAAAWVQAASNKLKIDPRLYQLISRFRLHPNELVTPARAHR